MKFFKKYSTIDKLRVRSYLKLYYINDKLDFFEREYLLIKPKKGKDKVFTLK